MFIFITFIFIFSLNLSASIHKLKFEPSKLDVSAKLKTLSSNKQIKKLLSLSLYEQMKILKSKESKK
jgi:hypothetical protein